MVIQVSSCRRNRSPSVKSRRHLTAGPTSPSGRAVDRPEGSIDDEAVPSHSDTDKSAVDELRRHRDPSADDT